MFRFHFIIFSFLFFLASVFSAELTLIGDDSFTYGSSCWQELSGVYLYRPALLNNAGEIIFIAQVSDDYRFRGIYKKISPYDSAAETLIDGKKSFLDHLWFRSAWLLNNHQSVNDFFALLEEQTSSDYDKILNIVDSNNEPLINLKEDLQGISLQKTQFTVSASGELLAITNVELDIPLFYEFDGKKFTISTKFADKFDGYNKKGIAINHDGTKIYFASTFDLTEDPDYVPGILALYAYDIEDENHKLVDFLGASFLDPDPEIICAAAAEIVVFRNGNKLIIAEAQERGGFSQQEVLSGEFSNPQAAQISSDGRFIVFAAKPKNGSANQQIYRYDRLRGTLQAVSQSSSGSWAESDCDVPSISPNGRYVSFVSQANILAAGQLDHPQLWLADLGPSLLPLEINCYIQEGKIDLPIEISGASDDAKIILTAANEQANCITFYDNNGVALFFSDFSTEYDLNSLPWTFAAACSGSFNFTLQLIDGTFTEEVNLQINIFSENEAIISCMSLNENGEYVSSKLSNFSDISCDENGKMLAFVTSLPLLHDKNQGGVFHAYLKNTQSGELKILSESALDFDDSKIAISGDGNTVLYTAKGKLWQYTAASESEVLIENGINNIKPAINYDASVIAYSQNNNVHIQTNDENTELELHCKKLQLSRDGKVLAILTDDNELYLYFLDAVEEDRLLLLAEDVEQFAMSQNGLELYFIQGDNLYRRELPSDVSEEVTLPEGISASVLANLQLSGNARFLSWVRDYEFEEETYEKQQFLYDIVKDKEILLSGTELEPGDGPCSTLSPTALSASGRKIFFASSAGNLTAGDNNAGQNLFLAKFADLALDSVGVIITEFAAIEDVDNQLFTLQLSSSAENALVPILNGDFSTENAQISLLGPTAQRTNYAVKYTPTENFCGEDSFTIQIWDGSQLSEELELTVDVENVNDPPFVKNDFPDTEISEGEELSFDLLEYFDDIDLYNPLPYTDELSFSLPENSPSWLKITGHTLLLMPDYDAVSPDKDSKEFEIVLICTDSANVSVELSAIISVIDVKSVSFDPAKHWGYTVPEPGSGIEDDECWESLHSSGWNLLALPYTANHSEIESIFGTEAAPWIWNNDNNKYELAQELQAGQGFWIYLGSLDGIRTEEIVLENGRTSPAEINTGWNLIGNNWQKEQINSSEIIILEKNTWQKASEIPPGKAAWILGAAAPND